LPDHSPHAAAKLRARRRAAPKPGYHAPLVGSEASANPSVAVAIPAYNEADGIAGFLEEIDNALAPHVASLRLVVVDDASTDGTSALLSEVAPRLKGVLEVIVNRANRGHGPTLLTAYRHALQSDPDYVLQVDGDGQFHGSDLRRVLVLLLDDAHAVSGVRRFRQDPWFRMVMTRLLRSYVRMSFAVGARDPNCPLRGYEAPLLRDLLGALPDECLIPNLYLTVVAARRGLALLEVDVSHRVRRGLVAEGTTWKRGAYSPIPWRLVRFSIAALRESRSFRSTLDGV
jgi:dolichol-phosphate mannosyltransferase